MNLFPPLMLALITGYLFLSIWNFTRFGIAKVSGYHLIFKSALIGFLFWALVDSGGEMGIGKRGSEWIGNGTGASANNF